MKNKFYTEKEISFLKENIDKFGAAICAEKLERSEISVIQQCYRKIGHCCFVCNATKEEIKSLKFGEKFNNLTIDFSKTKHPKELAYFIGFFWADGHIRKDKSLIIEIIKEDADDIEHILKTLADFTIYERTRKNTIKAFFYKDYEKEICKKLNYLGKYSNSIESHEKIIRYIPDCFIKYFLRGLIDGDGNLYVSPLTAKHHSTQITIAGRSGQNWDYIINYIKEKYDIDFKKNENKYKTYKSSNIRATNKTKIINFLSQIYDVDDKIYLTRKFKKIKSLIENNESYGKN